MNTNVEFAPAYRRNPWPLMNAYIRWTGLRFRLRSARGTIAYSANRSELVALADSNGWNLQ